ncbi:MAG: hypothetical protein GYA21_10830 [Myxococcales bacterium]|nr:hypothetical protein [Myxococcales bacterium]
MLLPGIPMLLSIALLLVPPPNREPGAGPDLRWALSAVGDRSALTVVLWPDQWPAVTRAIRERATKGIDKLVSQKLKKLSLSDLGSIREMAEDLKRQLAGSSHDPLLRVLGAPTMSAAFQGFLAMDGGGPPDLSAIDEKRPLVAALYEPVPDEELSLLELGVPLSFEADLPPPRHRLLVPASDPKKLIAALLDWAGRRELRPAPEAASWPELAGGAFFPGASPREWVALIPDGAWLRVEAAFAEELGTPPKMDIERWHAELIAALKARAEAGTRDWPRTPAASYLAAQHELGALYLRPDALRRLIAPLGGVLVKAAMSYADPSERPILAMAGIAEIASAYLLGAELQPEIDDLVLAFGLDSDLRFRLVGSLTEAGERAFRTGASPRVEPASPAAGDYFATGWMGFDVEAAMGAVKAPAAWKAMREEQQFVERLREGGGVAALHLLFSAPLALAGEFYSMARKEQPFTLPCSASAVVAFVAGREEGEDQLGVALAFSFPEDRDFTWLSRMSDNRYLPAELTIKAVAGGALARWAMLLSGAKVFPGDLLGRPASLILEAVFLGLSGPILERLPHQGLLLAEALSGLTLRAWAAGSTVQAELRLPGAGPGPRQAFVANPAQGFERLPRAPESIGRRCLVEAGECFRAALAAMSGADPGARREMLARALAESEPSLACAEKDSDARTLAARARCTFATFMSNLDRAALDLAAEKSTLAAACAAGCQPACQKKPAQEELAGVRLPVLELSAPIQPAGLGSRIVVLGEKKPETAPAQGASVPLLLAASADTGFSNILSQMEEWVPDGSSMVSLLWQGPDGLRASPVRWVSNAERARRDNVCRMSGQAIELRLEANQRIEVKFDKKRRGVPPARPRKRGEPARIDRAALEKAIATFVPAGGRACLLLQPADNAPWRAIVELAALLSGQVNEASGGEVLLGGRPKPARGPAPRR